MIARPFTPDTLADRWGCSAETIRNMIREGRLKAFRAGGRLFRIPAAAVTMLGAGEKIEKVAQVLGHSNTATTYRVYARYLPEHMQDAVNVLDFSKIRVAGQ